MTRDEIIDNIEVLLRQHLKGIRGSIHQEPYKGDFFRLFMRAFDNGFFQQGTPGCMSADALTDTLVSRSPDLVEQDTWHTFRLFWSEWAYALKNVDRH